MRLTPSIRGRCARALQASGFVWHTETDRCPAATPELHSLRRVSDDSGGGSGHPRGAAGTQIL